MSCIHGNLNTPIDVGVDLLVLLQGVYLLVLLVPLPLLSNCNLNWFNFQNFGTFSICSMNLWMVTLILIFDFSNLKGREKKGSSRGRHMQGRRQRRGQRRRQQAHQWCSSGWQPWQGLGIHGGERKGREKGRGGRLVVVLAVDFLF